MGLRSTLKPSKPNLSLHPVNVYIISEIPGRDGGSPLIYLNSKSENAPKIVRNDTEFTLEEDIGFSVEGTPLVIFGGEKRTAIKAKGRRISSDPDDVSGSFYYFPDEWYGKVIPVIKREQGPIQPASVGFWGHLGKKFGEML